MIEIVKVCPLGKKCSEVVDGKIHECMWYTTIQGQNPQTGEQVDKQDCTINNMTLFLADMSRSNREVVANSNDARNASIEAISALATVITTQGLPQGFNSVPVVQGVFQTAKGGLIGKIVNKFK